MALLISLTMFSLFIPLYVYIGYPLLLLLLNKIKRPLSINKGDIQPYVTVIVSCFNESKVIEEKIRNCLSIDYPKEKIEFIFVSDGSYDDTDEIIKKYLDQRISLIRQEGRLGKTSGLNLAVPNAKGEIIVFSDANAMYSADAIKVLVSNFNDKNIGYVVGAALYTDGSDSAAAKSENSYWHYELLMKKLESNLSSVVGGDGAMYGIRKELYKPLDKEDINDFVNPLQIIDEGYRGIFEPDAKCFETTAGDFSKEARRKSRIVNRSFRGLMKVKSVLNPVKTGFFSFQIISHKLLRWLIPFFLIIGFSGCIVLSYIGIEPFHILTLCFIILFWLALAGYFFKSDISTSPIFYYPLYFFLVNMASFIGVLHALAGNIQITWDSARSSDVVKSGTRSSTIYLILAFFVSIFIFLYLMTSMHNYF